MTSCGVPLHDEALPVTIITWTTFGFAATSVVARLISRVRAFDGSGFSWDDFTIVLVLAILSPFNILVQYMVELGLGKDIWMLTAENITNVLFYFWLDDFFYIFIMSFTKISILMLYLRMWPSKDEPKKRVFQGICFALIISLSVYTVVLSSVLLMGCNPLSYAWLRWDGRHDGQCLSDEVEVFAIAGLNMSTDLIVFFLPIPKLLSLPISASKKIAVCATFLAGLVVTACSATRLQYLTGWGSSTNPTYDYAHIIVWSLMECNIGVVCACVPAMAGLLQRCWSLSSSSLSQSRASTPQSAPSTPKPSLRQTESSAPLRDVADVEMMASSKANSLKSSQVTALPQPPPSHGGPAPWRSPNYDFYRPPQSPPRVNFGENTTINYSRPSDMRWDG